MHINSVSASSISIGQSAARLARLVFAILSATALGAALMLSSAHAAAPQAKTQAPGVYRMTLGDFEITVVSDGTIDLPLDQVLTNIKPELLQTLLARANLKPMVETSVNTFLINTGSKLMLVDTGGGALFGPTLGKLLTNLRAAGYSPEQIDGVLITHAHSDHIGGLIASGHPAFANAVVYMEKREADYWLNPANLEKAPAESKYRFERAMMMLEPYAVAGKLHLVEDGTEIVPGIKAVGNAGHTPGHCLYVIESQGQKLLLWGDLVHAAAVQFPEPSVTIRMDADPKAAAAQRRKVLADAAAQGYWIGAAHISFPGLGHVREEGNGYAWTPANYTASLTNGQWFPQAFPR